MVVQSSTLSWYFELVYGFACRVVGFGTTSGICSFCLEVSTETIVAHL